MSSIHLILFPEKKAKELKTLLTVLAENLKDEPFASVLCYPKASEAELQKRLKELREHNIKAVEFTGKASALNLPVLGKGFVGIVVAAYLNEQRVALKIRRVDADRLGLQHEAQMLAKANVVEIGPKLWAVSNNFLLMQLIDGALLPEWLITHKKKAHVRRVLNDVLEQCWKLDIAGLDHGELSKANKHIIVDKQQKPWIVDFETASVNRRTSNVTSACQFLFISGGGVAKAVADVLGERKREKIIQNLKLYKNDRTRENFKRVMHVCLC
jgi:putative serine/threonine protein kinase